MNDDTKTWTVEWSPTEILDALLEGDVSLVEADILLRHTATAEIDRFFEAEGLDVVQINRAAEAFANDLRSQCQPAPRAGAQEEREAPVKKRRKAVVKRAKAAAGRMTLATPVVGSAGHGLAEQGLRIHLCPALTEGRRRPFFTVLMVGDSKADPGPDERKDRAKTAIQKVAAEVRGGEIRIPALRNVSKVDLTGCDFKILIDPLGARPSRSTIDRRSRKFDGLSGTASIIRHVGRQRRGWSAESDDELLL